MTRNEMIRLRRQMQRRIREVVAERRTAANRSGERLPVSESEQQAQHAA